MYVDHLTLADFRSYEEAEVALSPGVTVFVGANGQGKTNLVEAVDYLATLGSHRVSSDVPLVRAGAARAVVRARVRAGRDDDRSALLEIEITPGRPNRARLNRAEAKPRELLGILRTVVFSPEDLAVVKGDPSERRRFVDQTVVTRWPRMAGVKADYERVLRQRSALLKSMAARRSPRDGDDDVTLGVWNEQLARLGAELTSARLDTLAALLPHASTAYAEIAPTNNEARARYVSESFAPDGLALEEGERPDEAALTEALTARMAAVREDEVRRGVSLVGPHRDEVVLSLGDLPARGYASHGESWSLALALRLGALALLRADDIEPVLVLDDVFAELDATRRERLASSIGASEQILITAAVAEDVPEALGGARHVVERGGVRPR